MISKIKFILVLLMTVTLSTTGISQEQKTKKIQPKIMVIPYTPADRSIADELNRNDLSRLAISRVKEAFDKRNFPTVDLNAKLKLLQNDRVMELENQASIKQELIELSGADMYIETETTINRSNGGNSVTIILSAYDAFTGVSLANKSGVSPRFYTESFEKLVEKAVSEMTDDFMNTLQLRFDDMNANGRMLAMNITFSEDSEYDMDYEFGDLDLLSDKIEDWLENNSYGSYYHIQGVTATKMIVDEMRVPLKTENGKNFRVSKFVQKFRKYLKKLGLDTSRDLQGGRIFITIQ
ncbi:MAG: DUF6175 family protein [Saprospiraceae bacterium]|nr:DUF6175 family protein [Saprospiraceae bacterium]